MKKSTWMFVLIAVIAVSTILLLFGARDVSLLNTRLSPANVAIGAEGCEGADCPPVTESQTMKTRGGYCECAATSWFPHSCFTTTLGMCGIGCKYKKITNEAEACSAARCIAVSAAKCEEPCIEDGSPEIVETRNGASCTISATQKCKALACQASQ